MTDKPDQDKTLGGRYQILSLLGGGGFGETYLAADQHLPGRPQCVVKHLKPRLSDPTSLETAQRLFETEAQVLYRLSHYSRVPRLLAHFEEDQEFYLVQEFIDGENLGRELVPGVQLTEAQTVELLRDILEVLVYIHQHNVIHRDIKPSNLIRRKQDNKIVLIDFGAVKQLGTQIISTQGLTTRTIAIGSPGYMPNEQLAGKPRFCSDLYAVGMVAIQALTGMQPKELPEDPRTSEILWHGSDLLPEAARIQVSEDLARLIDRLVRYDFRQRYQSAEEVLTDLEKLAPSPWQAANNLTQVSEMGSPSLAFTTPPLEIPELVSERNIDYTALRDFLMAGAWREADQETHRIMFKVWNSQESHLTLKEIQRFPCLDLSTIDYLWKKYSNGRFGFTIQKAIWHEVGGTQYPGTHYEAISQLKRSRRTSWRVNSPLERFGNRVGWRRRDRWLDYNSLSFNLDAPEGHFPVWYQGAIGGGGQMAVLFTRIEECLD